MSDNIQKRIAEVAERRGLSKLVVEKAWKNQFKITKDTVTSATKGDVSTFRTVYLRLFGKFVPRYSEIKHMRHDKH